MISIGDFPWQVVALERWLGYSTPDALAGAKANFEESGWGHKQRVEPVISLCSDCAKPTGAAIHSVDTVEAGIALLSWEQPEDF